MESWYLVCSLGSLGGFNKAIVREKKQMKILHRLDVHRSAIFTFLPYSTSGMQMAGEGVGTALPKEFTTSSV